MNISLQKYCQEGNIKHFITSFFLSQFLFSAYMGYVSKQKGVMRDAMAFVTETCVFISIQMAQNFKI